MKDNDSVNSTMINRNWVLKRKRGKHPYSPDTSNGVKSNAIPPEPAENASSILEGKSELTSSRFSSKKKGIDGVTFLLLLGFIYLLHCMMRMNLITTGRRRGLCRRIIELDCNSKRKKRTVPGIKKK